MFELIIAANHEQQNQQHQNSPAGLHARCFGRPIVQVEFVEFRCGTGEGLLDLLLVVGQRVFDEGTAGDGQRGVEAKLAIECLEAGELQAYEFEQQIGRPLATTLIDDWQHAADNGGQITANISRGNSPILGKGTDKPAECAESHLH